MFTLVEATEKVACRAYGAVLRVIPSLCGSGLMCLFGVWSVCVCVCVCVSEGGRGCFYLGSASVLGEGREADGASRRTMDKHTFGSL